MISPFAPFRNATLRFQIASNELTLDRNGNLRPGKAIVQVEALLQQKRDPNREARPGVDSTAIWVEGYLVKVIGAAAGEELKLPAFITPDSLCAATWQGREGRFFLEFTAANPYLTALKIDLVHPIRGYFQFGSFVVEGATWQVLPPPEPITTHRELLIVSHNGQTSFSLGQGATEPAFSELFVNGVKATYGSEYLLDGTALTWLMADLPLQPGDEVELIYQ